MRTVIVGNNIAASNLLELLVKANEEVVGIVAEDRDCVSETLSWESPFIRCAERISLRCGIPLFVGNINNHAKEIKNLEPDLIASCRAACLIKSEILKIPKKGVTNLHYGLLPRYGGCDTIPHAILNGEQFIGVTLHYMDENFDTGRIIHQEKIDITEKIRRLEMPHKTIEVRGLTGHEVYCRANQIGLEIYLSQYEIIKTGREQTREQDLTKRLYYKKGEIDYQNNCINVENSTDEEISRHTRAFTYPAKKSKPYGILRGEKIELKLE